MRRASAGQTLSANTNTSTKSTRTPINRRHHAVGIEKSNFCAALPHTGSECKYETINRGNLRNYTQQPLKHGSIPYSNDDNQLHDDDIRRRKPSNCCHSYDKRKERARQPNISHKQLSAHEGIHCRTSRNRQQLNDEQHTYDIHDC